MPDALELLRTRRSVPGPALRPPAPTAEQLQQILTIAARVPDHGKLAPWRFILIQGESVPAFGEALAGMVALKDPSASADRLSAEKAKFATPVIVTVVSRAGEHPKIPVWEQELSVGAACMNLEHAANALGFGTQWITGWAAYDDGVKELLGMAPNEKVAGFIQIGTPSSRPEDRPRPELADIVTQWEPRR
jgi:nitroreductase